MASIEIVAPKPSDTFTITDVPGMPAIAAQARITGAAPDPTAGTTFRWTASIELDASTCVNGPKQRRIVHAPVSASVVGGQFAPTFAQIRGGILTLAVEAVVAGATLKASVTGIKVLGTNPSKALIASKFADQTLRQIAAHESTFRQFDGARTPLWSGDKLGGVGLMQITNPPPTDDEVWDWAANLARGQKILKEKEAVAKGYPARVRNSTAFRGLITQLNDARKKAGKPELTVTLPDFTADELRLDTIRGYNGFAGNDGLGSVLHEFRVPRDAAGGLKVVVSADDKTATITWERVPAKDRPQNTGDPDYVNHVINQQV